MRMKKHLMSRVLEAEKEGRFLPLKRMSGVKVEGEVKRLKGKAFQEYGSLIGLVWEDEEYDGEYMVDKINQVVREDDRVELNQKLSWALPEATDFRSLVFESGVELVFVLRGESVYEGDGAILIEGLLLDQVESVGEKDVEEVMNVLSNMKIKVEN